MAHNYYQEEIETMPVEEMKKLQSEKLVKQVKHVYDNVPAYRKKMDEKGVKPEDIGEEVTEEEINHELGHLLEKYTELVTKDKGKVEEAPEEIRNRNYITVEIKDGWVIYNV